MDSGGAVTEAILVRDSHQSVAQSCPEQTQTFARVVAVKVTVAVAVSVNFNVNITSITLINSRKAKKLRARISL